MKISWVHIHQHIYIYIYRYVRCISIYIYIYSSKSFLKKFAASNPIPVLAARPFVKGLVEHSTFLAETSKKKRNDLFGWAQTCSAMHPSIHLFIYPFISAYIYASNHFRWKWNLKSPIHAKPYSKNPTLNSSRQTSLHQTLFLCLQLGPSLRA